MAVHVVPNCFATVRTLQIAVKFDSLTQSRTSISDLDPLEAAWGKKG